MSVAFRNVSVSPQDPVADWPFEALAETLERGIINDWRPVLGEIRAHPWGRVARRVEHWIELSSDDRAAVFFGLCVAEARERAERAERAEVARRVREAIARSGLTAAEFAREVGTSASRLSTYASGRVMPSASMLLRIEHTAGP